MKMNMKCLILLGVIQALVLFGQKPCAGQNSTIIYKQFHNTVDPRSVALFPLSVEPVAHNRRLSVDVDGDNATDFQVVSESEVSELITVVGAQGNGVLSRNGSGALLPTGQVIGPNATSDTVWTTSSEFVRCHPC